MSGKPRLYCQGVTSWYVIGADDMIGGEGRRELRLDRSMRRHSDQFGGQR